MHWYAVSDHEFRVVVETAERAPGPMAVLGWATRYNRRGVPRSDEAMREIRDGDEA